MEEQNRQPMPETGTPAGNVATATAPAPRRVRRVGAVTFGLTLIGMGVLLLLSLILPQMDLLSALRFAPVVLVILGVEVLVYTARPGEKFKYDVLSILVCVLLILGVAGAEIVSRLAVNHYAWQNLEADLDRKAYTALQPAGDVWEVLTSVTPGHLATADEQGNAVLSAGDEVRAYVRLDGNYADALQFAKACRRVMDAAQKAGLPYTAYRFTSNCNDNPQDNSVTYALEAEGSWATGRTAEQLAKSVYSYLWYNGVAFDSQQELDEYLSQFEEDDDLSGVVLQFPETSETASTDTASN